MIYVFFIFLEHFRVFGKLTVLIVNYWPFIASMIIEVLITHSAENTELRRQANEVILELAL